METFPDSSVIIVHRKDGFGDIAFEVSTVAGSSKLIGTSKVEELSLDVHKIISGIAHSISETVSVMSDAVKRCEIEVEFGICLKSGVGFVVSKMDADVNMKVKIRKPPQEA